MRERVLNCGVKLRRRLQILIRFFFSCCVWGRGGGCLLKNSGGCDKVCMYPVLHVCGMHMYRSVFQATEKKIF